MKLEKICNWIHVGDITIPDTLPHIILDSREQLEEVIKQLDLHNVFYYPIVADVTIHSRYTKNRYKRYIIIAPLAIFEYVEEVKKEDEENKS